MGNASLDRPPDELPIFGTFGLSAPEIDLSEHLNVAFAEAFVLCEFR
jgi:hypothetical protein